MTEAFPVLIRRSELLPRIAEMADEISRTWGEQPPVLIAVIEGARVFARHLARALPGRMTFAEVRARSYGDRLADNCEVRVAGIEGIDVAGREVLLIEDIVDTGRTVAKLREVITDNGALGVCVACMLSKAERRLIDVDVDYIGFDITDHFVVGFGMDFAGRYRDLPEIVIHQHGRELSD